MTKKMDTIFVLALLTLFAATSFVLVLIGAKQYRHITNTMSENFEVRTTASYIAEKIRQNDAQDAIDVVSLEDVPALCIYSFEGDIRYMTYIYYYDNALRELIVTEHSVYDLSSGQEIIQTSGFTPFLVYDSLLCTEVTDSYGNTKKLYFHLHSSSERRTYE